MEAEPVWDRAGRIVLPGRSMGRVFLIVFAVFLGCVFAACKGYGGAKLMSGVGLLASIFFGIQLLPGANRLELTRAGFTCIMAFCRYPVAWRDVSLFAVDEMGNVVWNYAAHVVHESRKARSVRIARQRSGYDACLPDTYGLSAGALAALMNRLKAEAKEEAPSV